MSEVTRRDWKHCVVYFCVFLKSQIVSHNNISSSSLNRKHLCFQSKHTSCLFSKIKSLHQQPEVITAVITCCSDYLEFMEWDIKKNVTKYQNLTIISSHLSLVTCVPLQFKMYISHCRYLNYDDFFTVVSSALITCVKMYFKLL